MRGRLPAVARNAGGGTTKEEEVLAKRAGSVENRRSQADHHTKPIVNFRVPQSLMADFDRARDEARAEGVTTAEWLVRAMRTYWQAKRRDTQPRNVSPLPFLEAVELGRLLEELENAFAEGRQERLDVGFYRTWVREHRIAASYLRQWLAGQSFGEAFATWWQDRVVEPPEEAASPQGGRTA